mgnify:CR=1 FL=1
MDHPIELKIDLMTCDHLDRYTEDSAKELLALANDLEREAQEKLTQARQCRNAAEVLLKAHAVFDLSDSDATDTVPDDEIN